MKNIGIKTAVIAVVLAVVGWQVQAANVITVGADESAALRVYNGATGTVTAVVETNGEHIVVTVDGNATTLTAGSSYIIISTLAAGIAAVTNAAGEKKLTVDSACALAADSTDDELLDGTYTATAGNWLELLWDTDVHKSYDIYLPSRTYHSVGAYTIGTIFGEPTGTGDVTLNIYKNRTLISRKIVTSPYYVLTVTNTINAIVPTVNLNEEVNLPASGGDPIIIRATRGTTATTGILSVAIDD